MTPGRLPLPIGNGAEERRRRVLELRRLVEAGRYRVPAEDVADAIIDTARRSRER